MNPRQYNFAGIGTTGGGVPGDSFKDVSTGVLGQIQHLVAYSGERVANPVAPRTVLKQDEIIAQSLRLLKRPVRFSDLSRRGRSTGATAAASSMSRSAIARPTARRTALPCIPRPIAREDRPEPVTRKPVQDASAATARTTPRPSQTAAARETASPMLADSRGTCGIWSASYGGDVSVLIRSIVGRTTELHRVAGRRRGRGQPGPRLHRHPRRRRRDARALPTKEAAFSRAFELCPRPS